jgi:hypothetical protein
MLKGLRDFCRSDIALDARRCAFCASAVAWWFGYNLCCEKPNVVSEMGPGTT